jgi:hypothetical protein
MKFCLTHHWRKSSHERTRLLEEVEAVLESGALVVDACRYVVRGADTAVSLARRPVLNDPRTAIGITQTRSAVEPHRSQRLFL